MDFGQSDLVRYGVSRCGYQRIRECEGKTLLGLNGVLLRCSYSGESVNRLSNIARDRWVGTVQLMMIYQPRWNPVFLILN